MRHSIRHAAGRHTALACLCWAFAAAAALAAHPTAADPTPLVPAGPLEEPQRLGALAERLYQQSYQEVVSYTERAEADTLKPGEMDDIGRTMVQILQLRRIQTRLSYWGEPLGVDLGLRVGYLEGQNRKIIAFMRTKPEVNQRLAAAHPKLVQQCAAEARGIPKVYKLLEQDKPQQAEDLLLGTLDELEVMGSWYDGGARDCFKPFEQPQGDVHAALHPLLRQAAYDALTAAVAQSQPDFATLQTEIERVAAEYASSGQAAWQNEQLDGGQTVASLLTLWRAVQLATLRTRGFQWSLASSAGPAMAMPVPGGGALPGQPGAQGGDELVAAYGSFGNRVLATIAQIIESDAARLDAASAAAAHADYVARCAELLALRDDDRVAQPLQAALDKLAAKSPELAAQATAYASATGELLRWRERTAAAHVQAQTQAFPDLAATFRAKVERKFDSVTSTTEYGMYMANAADQSIQLLDPPPLLFGTIGPKLLGQPVQPEAAAFALAGLSGTPVKSADAFHSVLAERATAVFAFDEAASAAWDAELTQLRSELLANAQPPLTLAAAAALRAGELRSLQQAGGTVAGLELRMLVTLFQTAADDAESDRFLLGVWPGETLLLPTPPTHALLEFQIQPRWYRHRYWFVQPPAPPPAT